MKTWTVFAPSSEHRVIFRALRDGSIKVRETLAYRSMDELRSLVRSVPALEALAVAGGDRAFSAVVDTIMLLRAQDRPVLGLLPSREGSDFARIFGIGDLEEAVQHLGSTGVYQTDVGAIEGTWGRRHFLNAASVGAAAGRLSARNDVTVITPKRTYDVTATAVLFCNGEFAGGLRIAPRATVVDGELDVQIWDVDRADRRAFLAAAATGAHVKDCRVRRTSTPSFRLETRRPWKVYADGELVGATPVSGFAVREAVPIKI